MRRNRRNSIKKEKIIMLASSALVLTALTLTGIYLQAGNEEARDDGYTLDFTALEENAGDKLQEIAENQPVESQPDELVEIPSVEADSGKVEIPGITDKPIGKIILSAEDEKTVMDPGAQEEAVTDPAEEEAIAPEEQEIVSQDVIVAKEFHFAEADGLARPLDGEILIPFSMDKSVYFTTLDQYKYNPALILSAKEGDNVCAGTDGKVTRVFEEAEIGHAITMDLGDGYELTYGQLSNMNVTVGSEVNAGDVLGTVAAPTKYYSKEGANLYLKLTKDGTPMNPNTLFQ